MKRHFLLCAAILAAAFQPALSTTWATVTVVDPISGAECEVSTPASSGSYVYDWPSRYDGVFWPYTEFAFLWYCPTSGYTSFGDDFEEISDEERGRVAAFLKSVKPVLPEEPNLQTRLWLADRIYALRDKDDEWRAGYLRIHAYLLGALADEARRAAIPLLEQSLPGREPDVQLVIDRLVLARYRHCFEHVGDGHDDLAQALKMIPELTEAGERAKDYLHRLAADIEDEMSKCRGSGEH